MLDYKIVSLANQVYERLEQSILDEVYPQGSVLSEGKLSEELGVSRTPVREALTRLEAEGFVANRSEGIVVLGITEKDVEDMYQIKLAADPLAAAEAALHIDDRILAQMKDIIDQQEYFAMKGNVEKVKNLDTEFHDLIYKACGSVVFETVLSPLHHKLSKYRKTSLAQSNRLNASVEEHKEIYEGLAARDSAKVKVLMLNHVESARKSICE